MYQEDLCLVHLWFFWFSLSLAMLSVPWGGFKVIKAPNSDLNGSVKVIPFILVPGSFQRNSTLKRCALWLEGQCPAHSQNLTSSVAPLSPFHKLGFLEHCT